MKLALGNAWVKALAYFGGVALPALFVIALMYILYKKRADRSSEEKFFITYTIVFLAIYFFPVTAYIIGTKMIGRNVYWRMFWLLPIEMIMAYVLTKIISSIEEKYKRVIFFMLCTGVVVCLGSNLYKVGDFQDKSNWHKLKSEVLEVSRLIEADAASTGNGTVAVAASDIAIELRVYDADIIMPYGRNALKGEDLDNEKVALLFDTMESEVLDPYRLAFLMDRFDIPYVVYSSDEDSRNKLEEAGFRIVGDAGSYRVYSLEADYGDCWLLTQYGNGIEGEKMLYSIQNQEGYTILIDGTTADYENGARYVISEFENKIEAWIVTDTDDDQLTGLNNILSNPGKIKVDDVCHVANGDELSLNGLSIQVSYDGTDSSLIRIMNTDNETVFDSGTDVISPNAVTYSVLLK